MRHLASIFACGLIWVAGASGQATSATCPAGVQNVRVTQVSGSLRVNGVVPLAPGQFGYSLVRMSTQVQMLGNGAQIMTRTETHEWRDSDGRTRNEVHIERNGEMEVQNVSINDPVSRENITLYPRAKVAQVNHFSAPAPAEPQPADKAFQETMRAFQEAMKPQYEAQQDGWKRENTNEQLGVATIAGECVQGTLWTLVIPAGEIGNDVEIRSVNESWWAPRLGIQMRFVLDDPRQGHIVNEVTELHVGNPDASVFRPPPEYQVFDLTPPERR